MKERKKTTTAMIECALWNKLRRNEAVVVRANGLFVRNVKMKGSEQIITARIRHECDMLSLTAAGRIHEIEIKITKADIRAESKKSHGHDRHNCIDTLSYAVPIHLEEFIKDNVHPNCGIWVFQSGGIWQTRKPKARGFAIQRQYISDIASAFHHKMAYKYWALHMKQTGGFWM